MRQPTRKYALLPDPVEDEQPEHDGGRLRARTAKVDVGLAPSGTRSNPAGMRRRNEVNGNGKATRCDGASSGGGRARPRTCALVNCSWEHRRGTLARRSMIMSASHHPTDIHLRRHRAKKRNKLRARIAAAPATGRAALEARVQRTYSPFHSMKREKLPQAVV